MSKYNYLNKWISRQSDGEIDALVTSQSTGSIYAWINRINSMIYVGKTTDLYSRMDSYKSKKGKDQPKLYNAIIKYGFENFKLEIIESNIVPEHLSKREKFWIRHLNTFDIYDARMGYNLTEGGDGFVSGEAHPNKRPEVRKKLSDSKLGSLNPQFGKDFSKEHRAALSEAGKGRKVSESSKRYGPKNNNYGKPAMESVRIAFEQANICRQKPFMRRDTKEIFNSLNEACQKYGINKSNLSKHLKRKIDREGIKEMQFDYIKKL